MSIAYGYDLRIRVVDAVEAGMKVTEISKLFQVSRDTIYKWKKIKTETGDVKPKKAERVGPPSKMGTIEAFQMFLDQNPDQSTTALAKSFGVSQNTMWRYMQKLNLTYKKKTFVHPKRDENARQTFINEIATIDKSQLIFLDEAGNQDNMCREYGWSLRGTRCYGVKAFRHKRRVNMIAALVGTQFIAPMVFNGTCNKALFEAWITQSLVPELKHGQIIVMDNINFHKSPKVHEAIVAAGCKIKFLPTYSPDLNPIEHYWFKVKNHIRNIAHKFDNFFDAVCAGLNIVSTNSY